MRSKSKPRATKPEPALMEATANEVGRRGEQHTRNALGGVFTPGSGNKNVKGDILHGRNKTGRTRARGYQRMIEKKSTAGHSIKLERAWLEKLEHQAFGEGKDPVLVIEFDTTVLASAQWAVIPLEKLREYFEMEDAAVDK